MLVAAALAAFSMLLFGPAGVWLQRACWPRRAPRAAIVLWQAIGLTGALAAVGSGLALAVGSVHAGLAVGVADLLRGAVDGHPPRDLGAGEAFGLTIAADVAAVLIAGMVTTATRTFSARRRHRMVLDLVGSRSERVPDALLLDDPRATAYCLPGIRPRIVVSEGTLRLLDGRELGAVVAHENGHVHEHHDLALLPFASMVAMLNWMPYVRRAPRAVAELLEMAADDYAARTHDPKVLASALVHMVSSSAVPACAFAASGGSVARRVRRLVEPDRTSRLLAGVTLTAAAALLVVPLVALVLPV